MPQSNSCVQTLNDQGHNTLPPTIYTTGLDGTTFLIVFPYEKRTTDIVVFTKATENADPVLRDQGDENDEYTVNNDTSSVVFNSAPGGHSVIIGRRTNICNMLAQFQVGAAIRAGDLNMDNKQLLFLIQELRSTIGFMVNGNDNDPIIPGQGMDLNDLDDVNVGDPVDPNPGVLRWNGTAWVSNLALQSGVAWASNNNTFATTAAGDARWLQGGGGTTDLVGGDSITVTVDSPAAGQVTIAVTDSGVGTTVTADGIDVDQVTIWGQDHDHSGNVSGDMSSVGNINFSAGNKEIVSATNADRITISGGTGGGAEALVINRDVELASAATTGFGGRTYTWPTAALTANTVLTTDANGNLSWTDGSGQAGNLWELNGTDTRLKSATDDIEIRAGNAIKINGSDNGDNTRRVTVQSPQATANFVNWTLTLPIDAGESGQILRTDGDGVTSWVSPDSDPIWTKDGSDVHLTTNSDNVGIGTSDPAQKLHVEQDTGPLLCFSDGTTQFGFVGSYNKLVGSGDVDQYLLSSANGKSLTLRAPTDNTIAFDIQQNEAMRIQSNGDVLMKNDLLMDNANADIVMNPGSNSGSLVLSRSGRITTNVNAAGNSNVAGANGGGAQIDMSSNQGIRFDTFPNTAEVNDAITLSERMRINSEGNILIPGDQTAKQLTATNLTPRFEIRGTTWNSTTAAITRVTDDTAPPTFILAKARGDNQNAHGAVQANDVLGALQWAYGDGDDLSNTAGRIYNLALGNATSNSLNTGLLFRTSAGVNLKLAMKMNHLGQVVINPLNNTVGTTESTFPTNAQLHVYSALSDSPARTPAMFEDRSTGDSETYGAVAIRRNARQEPSTELTGAGVGIGFQLQNSNSTNFQEYAYIGGGILNNDGTPNGALILATSKNGTRTRQVTINQNGKLFLEGTDAGIQFGTDNTPGSASSKTLDDYEEGTWGPELSFGGARVSMNQTIESGDYTKVGNVVNCQFQIRLSAKGTSTGTVAITLPFTVAQGTGSTNDQAVGGSVYWQEGVDSSAPMKGAIQVGANAANNNARFYYVRSSGSVNDSTSLTDAECDNDLRLIGSISYITAE